MLNRGDEREAAAGQEQHAQQQRIAARALRREPDRIRPQGHVQIAPRVDGQESRPVGERDGQPEEHPGGQHHEQSGVFASQARDGVLSRTATTERLHRGQRNPVTGSGRGGGVIVTRCVRKPMPACPGALGAAAALPAIATRLRRTNLVAAVAFTIGGSLFAIGAWVAQVGSGDATTAACIYFAGGLFFNTGGYASVVLVSNTPVASAGAGGPISRTASPGSRPSSSSRGRWRSGSACSTPSSTGSPRRARTG